MDIPEEMPEDAIDPIDPKTRSKRSTNQAVVRAVTMMPDGVKDPDTPVPLIEDAHSSKDLPSTELPQPALKNDCTLSTKMEIATAIFNRMRKSKGTARKEIIDQFVEEAKLSKAGAATYYQLIKAKTK